MMMDVNDFFQILMYIFGCALLVALTVLTVKVIHTLKKVDLLLDDLTDKSSKLNGVFSLADRSADAINSIVGNMSSGISNVVMGIIHRKGRKDDE